jgi:hypothetical protein
MIFPGISAKELQMAIFIGEYFSCKEVVFCNGIERSSRARLLEEVVVVQRLAESCCHISVVTASSVSSPDTSDNSCHLHA